MNQKVLIFIIQRTFLTNFFFSSLINDAENKQQQRKKKKPMAVVENGGVGSSRNFETPSQESSNGHDQQPNNNKHTHMRLNHNHNHHIINGDGGGGGPIVMSHHDQTLYITPTSAQQIGAHRSNSGGGDSATVSAVESYNRDMRELQELFSKLNPMAEEFVPPSLANNNQGFNLNAGFYSNNLVMQSNNRNGFVNGNTGRRVW